MGSPEGPWYVDYFDFPGNLYESMPEFALGRAGFDNWFIWRARGLNAVVFDETDAVVAVHQTNEYSHAPGGRMYGTYVS